MNLCLSASEHEFDISAIGMLGQRDKEGRLVFPRTMLVFGEKKFETLVDEGISQVHGWNFPEAFHIYRSIYPPIYIYPSLIYPSTYLPTCLSIYQGKWGRKENEEDKWKIQCLRVSDL